MMRSLNVVALAMMLLASACGSEVQAEPDTSEEMAPIETEAASSRDGSEDEMGLEDASLENFDDDRMARMGMPAGISEEYYSCLKRGNYATFENMQCISQEKVRQDKRLNDLYQELLRMLDGKRRAQLIDAQRAWLNSRSKDESLEAMLYGREQVENAQVVLNDLVRLA